MISDRGFPAARYFFLSIRHTCALHNIYFSPTPENSQAVMRKYYYRFSSKVRNFFPLFPIQVVLTMKRGGTFLKKLWCCVGEEYNKIIWINYQLG